MEKALREKTVTGDLADRCRNVLKRRMEIYGLLSSAERYAQGEGWKWYESSGWETLTGDLFAVAGEVSGGDR